MPFNPSGSRPLYAIMLLCSLVGAGTAIAVGDPLKTVAFGMFVVIGVCGVIIGWR